MLRRAKDESLISHTGVPLTREVAYRFAIDPTRHQEQQLYLYAGAARLAFNHHLARVMANLDQRAAEKTYGLADGELTPALSWSKYSFINEFNAWKNGELTDSPVNADGSRGLAWRDEVSADVFECASVDAAQALANFSASRKGTRRGKPIAFPTFKARHKTKPAFRLRNRAKHGAMQPVRVTGPKALLLPKLGELRVHGCTRTVRRLLEGGRMHLYSVTIRREKGRWWMSVTGVAAEFHPARRSRSGRHQRPAGVDRGLKSLAVVADSDGLVLQVAEGVKALQHAQKTLRRANKAFARTKPGSCGRRKARERLTRIHARVAYLRTNSIHQLSAWATTSLTRLTVEDLHVAGMARNRSLARSIADAAMATLGQQLAYKARWYGLELHPASRWFASSKTCSGCGQVKAVFGLSERTYRCDGADGCGLIVDRDVNAAVNLARWPDRHQEPPPRAAAA